MSPSRRITLHTGVSSLEGDEDPYPESFDVPPATARLVNLTRQRRRPGHRGRHDRRPGAGDRRPENEPGAGAHASPAAWRRARAATGWTSHVVTPQTGVRVVDGLLTGLHEPRSTHLWMLAAFAGEDLLSRCYAAALERGYLWHEFGDVHLLLP